MGESSLSSAELTRHRAAVAAIALVGTAIVMRPTEVDDGAGNIDTTYAASGTYDCGLFKRVRRVEIDIVSEREAEANFYQVLLPFDADVEPDDRLTIDSVTYSINILWKGHTMALGTRARITRLD